jgi:hypothetical protein
MSYPRKKAIRKSSGNLALCFFRNFSAIPVCVRVRIAPRAPPPKRIPLFYYSDDEDDEDDSPPLDPNQNLATLKDHRLAGTTPKLHTTAAQAQAKRRRIRVMSPDELDEIARQSVATEPPPAPTKDKQPVQPTSTKNKQAIAGPPAPAPARVRAPKPGAQKKVVPPPIVIKDYRALPAAAPTTTSIWSLKQDPLTLS